MATALSRMLSPAWLLFALVVITQFAYGAYLGAQLPFPEGITFIYLGNVQSADIVRKVCDHLTYCMGMSFRPVEDGPTGLGPLELSDFFKAHHALAALGFKNEALSRLQVFESKYYGRMDQQTQQKFRHNLENARNW